MKKQFVKPGIKVVEIDEAEIICTSQTEPYQNGNTDGWYN